MGLKHRTIAILSSLTIVATLYKISPSFGWLIPLALGAGWIVGGLPFVTDEVVLKEKTYSKVAVITGCSSGIGEQLAYEFSKLGCYLMISARRVHLLQKVKEKCKKAGSANVEIVKGDFGKPEDCKMLIAKAIERYGRIDYLVINHAMLRDELFVECEDVSVYRQLMDVNYYGPIILAHEALPELKKTEGRIVLVGSASGLRAPPFHTGYASTKGAAMLFFEGLGTELQHVEPNISVTVCYLGMIATEEVKNFGDEQNKMAYPVERCAQDIIRASYNRHSQVFIPHWVFISAVFTLFPSFMDWVMDKSYVSTRPDFLERLKKAKIQTSKEKKG